MFSIFPYLFVIRFLDRPSTFGPRGRVKSSYVLQRVVTYSFVVFTSLTYVDFRDFDAHVVATYVGFDVRRLTFSLDVRLTFRFVSRFVTFTFFTHFDVALSLTSA